MASIKKTPNGSFQLTVRNKLLPKTFWATFSTYEEAERYGRQLDALLAQGVVPESLLKTGAKPSVSWSVDRCVAEYARGNDVPVSDLKILDTVKSHWSAWQRRT
jgi:hypothetical protein